MATSPATRPVARLVSGPRSVAASCFVVLALVLSGCGTSAGGGDGGEGGDAPDPTAASSRPGAHVEPELPEGDPTPLPVPVADPEHAVAPPGPRAGPLVPPDLLVYDQEPLPDRLVERIAGLRRVDRTERLTLAGVGIQNRVITLGAVDPATYRNYTRVEAAELQAAWDRVAGGELAVTPTLGRRLPRRQAAGGGKADGYLTLGNDADAPKVHVGALVPQVPQIDAVVNEAWGEELGMPMGNALLVTTGIHSPREVRKAIRRIVGSGASVTILGPDLDPGATQTAVLTGGSVAQAVGTFRYTVLDGGRIEPERAWVEANIRTEEVPILGRVTCHRVVLPQLRAALEEIRDAGLSGEIHPDEYAGCYYPRFIAGTQQLSLHSFGIALDLNVPGNQRGTVGEMNRAVVAIFERWGFAWGGDWAWTDPMHFEMNAVKRPG